MDQLLQWIHPTVVHFPIALLFAALLFDSVAIFRNDEKMLFAGFWCGLLGAVSLVFAIVSGFFAASHLGPHSQTGNAVLGFHKAFAYVVAAVVAAMTVWRVAMRGYVRPRSRTLYLALSLFCAVMVFIAGALGGFVVYASGLGIPPETARRILEAQPSVVMPKAGPRSLAADPTGDAGQK